MKSTSAACLLLLGAACTVQNGSMIEIDGRAAPDDVPSCKFAPGGENILGPGVLDVASPTNADYRLVLYVKNNIPDPKVATPEALTAAKIWYPYAARVRVNPKDYTDSFGPSPALLGIRTENTTPLAGEAVQPGGGTHTLLVEAVSTALGNQIAMQLGAAGPDDIRRVVLGISLLGRTGDGASLDSAEWFFPLDVCSGCLAPPAASTCATGQVLLKTNCFSNHQDSVAACGTPTTK